MVASLNVTSLTVARLRATSETALKAGANILLLQETKHTVAMPRHLAAAASQLGWQSQWSAPLSSPSGYGGTAILWRTELGSGAPQAPSTHRRCVREWPFLAVASTYGDASGEDLAPIHDALAEVHALSAPVKLVFGDLNWKRRWTDDMPGGWYLSSNTPSTTSNTAPTRAILWGQQNPVLSAFAVQGIPYHHLMVLSLDMPSLQLPPQTRDCKTASYRWDTPPSADQMQHLLREVEATSPAISPEAGLGAAWYTWHNRAETLLKEVVNIDLGHFERSAERPKGSFPNRKACSIASPDRAHEPVALRRLRRLHRQVADELLHAPNNASLGLKLRRKFDQALIDRLLLRLPVDLGTAADLVSSAISGRERELSLLRHRKWKSLFCGRELEEALPPLEAGTLSTVDAIPHLPFALWEADWTAPICPFTQLQTLEAGARAVIAVTDRQQLAAVFQAGVDKNLTAVFLWHHQAEGPPCWVWQGEGVPELHAAPCAIFPVRHIHNHPTRRRKFPLRMLQAASRVLKPQGAVTFTAQQVREQWAPIWQPASVDGRAEAWEAAMIRASGRQPVPPQPLALPPLSLFRSKLLDSSGSPGRDGWMPQELKAIARFCPQLLEELYELLVFTVSHHDELSDEEWDLIYGLRIVGIPKAKPGDSRPLGVASIIVRAWHSALLPFLPGDPDDQDLKLGTVRAFARWWSAPGVAGSEHDLTTAFDRVAHPVALAALRFEGTSPAMLSYYGRVLRSPRYPTAGVDVAEPVHPTSGLPQGDPTSPKMLNITLAPWSLELRARHNVEPAAYIDDRSIKAPSVAIRDAAIASTRAFDEAIGYVENQSKVQFWVGDQDVEHLGLRAQGRPPPPFTLVGPRPRGGWERLLGRIGHLAALPGGPQVKCALAQMFIKPLWAWPGPLHVAPPLNFAPKLRRAIVGSNTWYDTARLFADQIQLHPYFGAAADALAHAPWAAALSTTPWGIPLLQEWASILKLEIYDWTPDGGVWAYMPRSRIDSRLHHILWEVKRASPSPRPRADTFQIDTKAGAHFLRQLARVRVLETSNTKRYDFDGLDKVCVAASHCTRWKTFLKRHSSSDQHQLIRWRAGGVWTPSRRYYHSATPQRAKCPWCSEPCASMHHLVAHCPHFAGARRRQAVIPIQGWSHLPRCLTKTGWTTYTVADEVEHRTAVLLAVASVALQVIHELAPLHHQSMTEDHAHASSSDLD